MKNPGIDKQQEEADRCRWFQVQEQFFLLQTPPVRLTSRWDMLQVGYRFMSPKRFDYLWSRLKLSGGSEAVKVAPGTVHEKKRKGFFGRSFLLQKHVRKLDNFSATHGPLSRSHWEICEALALTSSWSPQTFRPSNLNIILICQHCPKRIKTISNLGIPKEMLKKESMKHPFGGCLKRRTWIRTHRWCNLMVCSPFWLLISTIRSFSLVCSMCQSIFLGDGSFLNGLRVPARLCFSTAGSRS